MQWKTLTLFELVLMLAAVLPANFCPRSQKRPGALTLGAVTFWASRSFFRGALEAQA